MACENNIKKELDKVIFYQGSFVFEHSTKRKINAKLWTYVPFLLKTTRTYRKILLTLFSKKNNSADNDVQVASGLHVVQWLIYNGGDYQSNCIFFHFIWFFKNIKKLRGGHFENYCFSIIITLREMSIVRYYAILDQSERAHLYNHLSNYTKLT